MKIKIVSAPRPSAKKEKLVTLQHAYNELRRLAEHTPLPGSPSFSACVDYAINSMKVYKTEHECPKCHKKMGGCIFDDMWIEQVPSSMMYL